MSQKFSKTILVMAIISTIVALIALCTTVPALAKGGNGNGKGHDKTTYPHHNKVDKQVPASCNSRHARDAGQGCDEDSKSPEKPPKGTPRIVDEFGGTGQYAVTVMVTYYLGDPAMSNGAGGGSGARMLV